MDDLKKVNWNNFNAVASGSRKKLFNWSKIDWKYTIALGLICLGFLFQLIGALK